MILNEILNLIIEYLNLKDLINLIIINKQNYVCYKNCVNYKINEIIGLNVNKFFNYSNNYYSIIKIVNYNEYKMNKLNEEIIKLCLDNIYKNIINNKKININNISFLFNTKYSFYKNGKESNKLNNYIKKYSNKINNIKFYYLIDKNVLSKFNN